MRVRDEIEALASRVVAEFTAAGLTVACAESCTGGLLAGALTDIPGSSAVFRGGVVAYANEIKSELLGIDPAIIADVGAVSVAVAMGMAQAVRALMQTDWAISTTGIAGPGGGSDGKPVGLVYIGVASPQGVKMERHLFKGDRGLVRSQTVRRGLELLLER